MNRFDDGVPLRMKLPTEDIRFTTKGRALQAIALGRPRDGLKLRGPELA